MPGSLPISMHELRQLHALLKEILVHKWLKRHHGKWHVLA
jgi:hypothetical protein